MISQKSIQEVLDIAQVDQVIEDYVTLKKRGANFIGLCPFHDEKTPSFTVSPSKNIYKCFGCGKGGGAVQFLMEHDQLTFPEAIRILAKRFNITLEEDSNVDEAEFQAQKKLEESYFIINEYANNYFKEQLLEHEEGKRIGLSYFKERGYNQQIIDTFGLGYTLNKKDHFTQKAKDAQFNVEYLKTLGLTSKNNYDFFRGRVMFPIHNLTGKVIAFAGRTLSTDKKQPKYINSPETPIYNKRRILYAMHLAKSAIRKLDDCFIVEGYTDVISLFQNGIENVVASSGTSLTSEQVRLVKRYTNNITFLYDGDAAGIKASTRGLDIVLESDMNVRLVMLPEGEDPDSFVKSVGHQAFVDYVKDNAKDFIMFKAHLSQETYGKDPIKKAELINDVISSIAKIRDSIKRSLYIRNCSQLFEMDERILVRETNKVIKNEIQQKRLAKEREARQNIPDYQEPPPFQEPFIPPDEKTFPTFRVKNKHEFQERDLARLIVVAGDRVIIDENGEKHLVADLIYSNISDVIDYFNNKLYKDIIEEGFKVAETEDKNLSDYFLNHKNSEIQEFAINANSSKYEFANWEGRDIRLQTQKPPENNFYRDSIQSIFRFKYKKLELVLKELGKKITSLAEEQDPEQLNSALESFKSLSEIKKEIAKKFGMVTPGS